MFENGLVASTEALMACVLTLSLAVAVHIAHGMGTKKAKESFVGGFLLLMVCTQCYYLILSSTYIPYFPYTYNGDLRRYDCVDSGKGGKRPGNARETYDINPCYCHTSAVCTLSNGTVLTDPTECPTSGATCIEGTGIGNFTKKAIDPYINNDRNCLGGAGIQCSREQPCDPCDRNSLNLFGRSGDRCRACYSDNRGECSFTPDRGPWCRVSPGSKTIEPCKTCCTEKAPIFIDGYCY